MWRHPEWWCIALSIGAWLALVSMPRHVFAHGTAADLSLWILMVIAMMFPLITAQVRDTAFRSVWARRHRSVAFFLAGYVVCWLLFGAAAVSIRERWTLDPKTSALLAITIAVAWQFSPWKTRALRNCHRVLPLAPAGWRADWTCVRFGWRIGGACVGACGALMAACALMDHSMLAMGVATAVATHDRLSESRPTRIQVPRAVFGAWSGRYQQQS